MSTTKHNQKPEDILKKPLGNGSSNKNFYSKNQISDLNFPKSLKKYRKILNAGVRFAVSCCQLLETVIFNETILALLPVESKANILYVNIYIYFTVNLIFGFGIYCGQVLPEPAALEHLHSENFILIFFS